MNRLNLRLLIALTIVSVVLAMSACGGGSSKTNSPSKPPIVVQPDMVITTNGSLPDTLTAQNYSQTLQVSNGNGALTWSISAVVNSSNVPVSGFTIDPTSGVFSGTAASGGSLSFTATVKDSSSPVRQATKNFVFNVDQALQPTPDQTANFGQYANGIYYAASNNTGVPPLHYSIVGGALPPGIHLDPNSASLSGTSLTTGTFNATVQILDSFTPPESATFQYSVKVSPPPLSAQIDLPATLFVNRSYNGKVVAVGGTPPYTFSMRGALPSEVTAVDPSSGTFTANPTVPDTIVYLVSVADSSTPPQYASPSYVGYAIASLGRNDSPATASLISYDGTFGASLSPYIDPPNRAPLSADNDYYKAVSLGGAVINLVTTAKRIYPQSAIDTVLQVVDANGVMVNTCRDSQDATSSYTSPCINDDIDDTTQDSAIEFQVPGQPNQPSTFYVRVLDWRGLARPDMLYQLSVTGLQHPMSVQGTPLPAQRGNPYYSFQFQANYGLAPLSWTISSGSLPPGLTINNNGIVSGTPTADGTFDFDVQVTDSTNPSQVVTFPSSITVVEPVVITSPAVWPDACLGQNYTFQVTTTGGDPPFFFGFNSLVWGGPVPNYLTGLASGIPFQTGTFDALLTIQDRTGVWSNQNVTLTVNNCP